MLREKLQNFNIILASGSPRRQQFFKELDIEYEIRLKPVDEVFSERLKGSNISDYLAQIKALPFRNELKENDILITADTIVWHENKALGKPTNRDDAFNMIKSMSGKTHDVISSVCFTMIDFAKTVNSVTKVTFKQFSDEEITYYINNFKPFDKAGSYGIQEWIGHIGVTKLEGSYVNVMGMPMAKVYKVLTDIAER
ncbi:Maf family nucleotide pyrophosphatase [Spongiivirga sp. MCCC 1A20706]|uniref:Maf family nucleotide pyrophosphatase n=1 Tax=Spongiivirga sp. MCCC 1A20706 TaxID=3160963 RepID=UPI0039778ED7